MNLKRILKLCKSIILILTLVFIGFYFYIKNYWKNFTDEVEIDNLITEIKAADKLPEQFYTLYEIDNPKSLENNLNEQILNCIFYSQHCYKPISSSVAAMFTRPKRINSFRRYKIAEISMTWKIEEKTSQRECLNWLTEKYDFLNNAKGIKEASKLYFNKNIEQLNNAELANLVVMLRNSSYYNPFRRQEKIDLRANQILRELKTKNTK